MGNLKEKIKERDKGKSPMVEDGPTYQPPKVKYVFSRQNGIVRKEKIKDTPTQSGESRPQSPMQQAPPSPPLVSSSQQVIDLDSPPREPSPKKRRVEAIGLVDYLVDLDDEVIVTSDDIMQNIPSPTREL